MTAQLKRTLAYLLSFSLAGFLLFLALQGVDIEELKIALKGAAYGWLLPFIAIILLSHALRAWRWQILLDALPDRQRTGELKSVSFKNAFFSVMIGYFLNLLPLRVGEFVRAANLANQEGFRFSGVFGTVVVERVVDVIVLAMGILSLSFLFYDEFLFLRKRILTPALEMGEGSAVLWPMIGVTFIGMVCFFAYRTLSTSQSVRLLQLRRRLISILKSFKDGVFTLLHAPRRFALIMSTVAMWFCYTVMAYIPMLMLDMPARYDIVFIDAWSIMILGAIGIAIPSPGGTGSYHYITKLALVSLFLVDDATALTYAVLAHGVHLVIYIATGVIALFIQGTTLKSLRSTALEPE